MKYLTILMVGLLIAGCSKDTVILNDHNDRITELERRADLNDQLDTQRDVLIQTNSMSITVLQSELVALDTKLTQMISDEEAARISGDQALQSSLNSAIFLQSLINGFVQFKLAQVNSKVSTLQGQTASLQSQVNDLNNDLSLLEDRVSVLESDVSTLQDDMTAVQAATAMNTSGLVSLQLQVGSLAFSQFLTNLLVQGQIAFINNLISSLDSRMSNAESNISDIILDIVDLDARMDAAETAIVDLESDLTALGIDLASTQQQLDEQGVQVFKCDSPSSEERLFKVNGKFYAVMNRVTTKNINVVTGSSSQSYTTPDMCETFTSDLKLPNAGGQCTPNSGPFKSTLIPGETIVVESYSTGSVKVVNKVKMALELLKVGNYITTDASNPGCTFSITNSGSTNLVPVQ